MRASFVALLVLLLLAPSAAAQKPKKVRLSGQYKRVHQRVLRDVLAGRNDEATQSLDKALKKVPTDGESHYWMAVVNARAGRTEQALSSMQKAIENGVPASRFLGGAGFGFERMRKQPAVAKLAEQWGGRPVHGPMLGCLTERSVKVWVRTMTEQSVQAIASKSGRFDDAVYSEVTKSRSANDHTAVVQLKGLEPNTTYHYRVRIDGKTDRRDEYRFKTGGKKGEGTKFRLAFGGGAGYVPPNERVWATIDAQKPDVLLLLGDNVYIDDPKTPEMQHYCYYRRQSRPEYRKLLAHTPVYAIWDDHDFGTNDCSGGPEIDVPEWKRPVYRVFRDNWVNPYYGGGDEQPGCYYDFYLGDVHFIMLDGRYYRNLKPKEKGKETMLGPVQRAWLLDTLRKTKGKFVVLCSPVPWVYKAKGKSRDTWNGFKAERTEIFDLLKKEKIEGVVLMSADRHRSDLWKIERDGAYSLFEMNSSRLTNQHVHPTMKQAVFSYNAKQSFGVVDFDTTADDPTVTYRIVNIDGKTIHSHTIRHSMCR